ncbi:hypothetical protein IW140_004020 [Coemansia sp. RSA 1813]|nr:hypothetical protein EV178_003955 [Coemansia sp. RSA 1646]KAJ1771133.1 hypothetical protein LPJ74_002626 [Coemansia sp. RSA 1843]KAJ2088477.1 hypothetical protein IW138_004165 [Coemansia sp. RSA 986]KAJ2217070.1 hypothetical protein EV179_000837 [Coemansia sp. RSA 487]KAJ2568292.1 hypothetical protein IW140_004020 [Coemansia sp. RSA 1813]
MDINDIFREKVTNTTLNASKNKRKMGAAPSLRELKDSGYGFTNDSSEPHKRRRPDDADEGAGRSSEIESEGVGDGDEDDEGGRFFSDGLTTQEKGVMRWVDHMEDMEDMLDHASVQRLVLRLERAVSRNTQDRIKHAKAPELFSESEAELDEAIQRLLMLANDVQYLGALEELNAVPTLVGLMAHENADITLDVVQLAVELTAEDSWSQEGESQEERAAVVGFVVALADNEFFEMLGQNLRRLNEDAESLEGEADRQGVFQTLTLIENLVSLDVRLAERAVRAAGLLGWLQSRIKQTKVIPSVETGGATVDSNQQYAAEIVSILLQSSPRLCEEVTQCIGFTDALLTCLANYRKRTPTDDIETEYLENIVDSLCMVVAAPKGKGVFVKLEGVELLVLLQKQQQHAGRLLSLKILDYALSPPAPREAQGSEDSDNGGYRPAETAGSGDEKTEQTIAKRYIDAMGLKYLFSILMHHGKGAAQRLFRKHPESDERAISCIAWLLRLTDRETPAHWRVLAKFMPSAADASGWKAYVDRVVELNVGYAERVREAEELFDQDSDGASGDEDVAEERYLSRMDAGLFSLQMTDIVMAFVVSEEQVRARIEKQLRRKGRSLDSVREELDEYVAAKKAKSLVNAEMHRPAEQNGKGKDKDKAALAASLSDIIPHL